ncbi:ZIP family metal transporter [Candidatus Pacearchaeota archaeon]|nr:ZIP family metal transporter [Candidatus Pacearchaeota archaeon]
MQTLHWIILMTSILGILGLAGVFTFFLSKKLLNKILFFLVALATGALLGGAFIHLIPESLEKLDYNLVLILLISGFAIFYFLEKALHWHHCHKHEKCDEHPFSYLTLYGDAIHNFVDGLIIASSFIISIPLGILTSLLIMAHELPQEIGNFGILVYGGFSRGKALFYSFLAQLTAILGGILGFYFLNLNEIAIFILPIAAGGFLYIAFMDLIPEIFKTKNKKKTLVNIVGIIIGVAILYSSKALIG